MLGLVQDCPLLVLAISIACLLFVSDDSLCLSVPIRLCYVLNNEKNKRTNIEIYMKLHNKAISHSRVCVKVSVTFPVAFPDTESALHVGG